MKSNIFVIALLAVVLGLGGCGSNGPKLSDQCDMTGFKVGTITYTPTADGFTWHYVKASENFWTGMPTWPASPSVTISEGATYEPKSADFLDKEVIFTVTAEDGKTKKTYKVKATKDPYVGGN